MFTNWWIRGSRPLGLVEVIEKTNHGQDKDLQFLVGL